MGALSNLRIISAGAGSGKTYRLTQELIQLIDPASGSNVRPSGIIATTFTKKAAAELQERVRVALLEKGLRKAADEVGNALIGTVHGLGTQLLKRFSFEAGLSPDLSIIADEDRQFLFNQSLASVMDHQEIQELESIKARFEIIQGEAGDWRKMVMQVVDLARSNNLRKEDLIKSARLSVESLLAFLPEGKPNEGNFEERLASLLARTIQALETEGDSTKKTASNTALLKQLQNQLKQDAQLSWPAWARMAKKAQDVGKKSLHLTEELVEFAWTHSDHPQFRSDVQNYVQRIFELAIRSMEAYAEYKRKRGLIDYTDMEASVLDLLDHPTVIEVLNEEIDLLMVDEFQDTNPIQLEIFLKLTRIADQAIWVGDPKQSIYGFRGAEPELMAAIIEEVGGVKAEDIQTRSWRSREDLVYFSNAVFTKAFPKLPEAQVALDPVCTEMKEAIELDTALQHWHYLPEGENKRMPGAPWKEDCVADTLHRLLSTKQFARVKGQDFKKVRSFLPKDVAVLCRSNSRCDSIAKALNKAGIKAALSRNGLLETREAVLILACMKYLLNPRDALAVAEIKMLGSGQSLDDIVIDRLSYLKTLDQGGRRSIWGQQSELIQKLEQMRSSSLEFSGVEILEMILQQLDIRRIVAHWSDPEQRLNNIEAFRGFARQYEDTCMRLHSASSLGGLLLWMNELGRERNDQQGGAGGEEAVNVLTYHKSKGLEWPMVILMDLDGKLKDNIWGLAMVRESEKIDLEHPLKDRWIRLWINPYQKQKERTPLVENIKASDTFQALQDHARAEEKRLLYVGITRARDYLVIPSFQRSNTLWLNRVANDGVEGENLFSPGSGSTALDWKGKMLPLKSEIFEVPRNFPGQPEAGSVFPYPIAPKGSTSQHLPLSVLEQPDTKVKLQIKSHLDLYPALNGDLEVNQLAAQHIRDGVASIPLNRKKAVDWSNHLELEEQKLVEQAITNARNWLATFPLSESIQLYYPIRSRKNGQQFEFHIDLLLRMQDRQLALLLWQDDRHTRRSRDYFPKEYGILLTQLIGLMDKKTSLWVLDIHEGKLLQLS